MDNKLDVVMQEMEARLDEWGIEPLSSSLYVVGGILIWVLKLEHGYYPQLNELHEVAEQFGYKICLDVEVEDE